MQLFDELKLVFIATITGVTKIQEKNIDQSSVTLIRSNDNKWDQLPTSPPQNFVKPILDYCGPDNFTE